MSDRPPHRHKRQKSAQISNFYSDPEAPPPFHPDFARRHGFDSQPLPVAQGVPIPHAHQLPQGPPVSVLPSSTYGLQPQPDVHYVPQLPYYEQPVFPFPEDTQYEFQPYLRQEYRPDYPRVDHRADARLEPQRSISHTKNLSISSHFDTFSLNETSTDPRQHYTFPQGRPHEFVSLQTTPPAQLANPGRGKREHSPEPQSVLDGILYLMLNVDASNLNSFLLDVLVKLEPGLPLDDFYNILYNSENSTSHLPHEYKIDKTYPASSLQPTVDAMYNILNVFRSPGILYSRFAGSRINDAKLAGVNFHELLRSFLAIKILFSALVEESTASLERATLPRISIYKLYYIICQRLILKYPSSSNSTSLQQKLILGQSKLGKLVKLVYPNLVSKRLGRRGESKYNYLGISWNTNIVDEEIAALCNEEITKLNDIFKGEKKQMETHRGLSSLRLQRPLRPSHHRRTSTASVAIASDSGGYSESSNMAKVSLSFIRPHYKYPAGSFSPMPLAEEHEISPLNWFGASRHHSLMVLQDFNVDLNGIRDVLFNSTNLETGDDSILRGIFNRLLPPILHSERREDRDYLHLFTVIAIEVLPHLLLIRSADVSFMRLLKSNVRILARDFVKEVEIQGDRSIDLHDGAAFAAILTRMLNSHDLLSTFIEMDLGGSVIPELQSDISDVVTAPSPVDASPAELSEYRQLLTRSLIDTLIANQFVPSDNGQPMAPQMIIKVLNEDSAVLQQCLQVEMMNFLIELERTQAHGPALHGESTQKTVHSLLTLLDTHALAEVVKLHYPISIFNAFTSLASTQLLQFVYRKHTRNGDSPNNSTFRHWWMMTSFVQEYFSVLGELVSLHETLTR